MMCARLLCLLSLGIKHAELAYLHQEWNGPYLIDGASGKECLDWKGSTTFALIQEGEDVHVSMRMQSRRQLAFLYVCLLLRRDWRVVVPGCTARMQIFREVWA